MKTLLATTCLIFAALFLTSDYATAQITFNSILVSGNASTGGDGNLIPDDSDSFSLNSFTSLVTASAQSGVPLNASVSSGSAAAEFDGTTLSIETSASAESFSDPLTASATGNVVIQFSLDSSFDVLFSSFAGGSAALGAGFNGGEFASNEFIFSDAGTSFTANDLETFRIGPGDYLFQSLSDTSGGFANGTASISFSAVPEPSSLVLLASSCLAMVSRRRRAA